MIQPQQSMAEGPDDSANRYGCAGPGTWNQSLTRRKRIPRTTRFCSRGPARRAFLRRQLRKTSGQSLCQSQRVLAGDDVAIPSDVSPFAEYAHLPEVLVGQLERLVGERCCGGVREPSAKLLHQRAGSLRGRFCDHERLPEIILRHISTLQQADAEDAFGHQSQGLLPRGKPRERYRRIAAALDRFLE